MLYHVACLLPVPPPQAREGTMGTIPGNRAEGLRCELAPTIFAR
jgi:hypothetical protein